MLWSATTPVTSKESAGVKRNEVEQEIIDTKASKDVKMVTVHSVHLNVMLCNVKLMYKHNGRMIQ